MTKTSWPSNDPGKHVQTLLSSSEWKALRKLADSFGWSLTETTRWAINETVDYIALNRSADRGCDHEWEHLQTSQCHDSMGNLVSSVVMCRCKLCQAIETENNTDMLRSQIGSADRG